MSISHLLALDPRFKTRPFETSDVFDVGWASSCARQLQSTLEHHFTDSPPVIPTSATVIANPFFNGASAFLGPTSHSAAETPDLQLRRYIAEPLAPMDCNPLDWWKLNAHRFPALAKMARIYLAIPGASFTGCDIGLY